MHDMNIWAGVKYSKVLLHIDIIHQVCKRRVCFCAGALKEALPFSSPARICKSFTRKSFSSTPKLGPHHLFNFYSIMRLFILSAICHLSMLDLLLGAPLSHCSQTIMGPITGRIRKGTSFWGCTIMVKKSSCDYYGQHGECGRRREVVR